MQNLSSRFQNQQSAADHEIPPNSSDSSVLPAGADDTISRAAALLASESFYVDASINLPLDLIPSKSDSSDPWDDSQTIMEAAFPSTAPPAPIAGNSSVLKISDSNSNDASDVSGRTSPVIINLQDF